MLAPALRETVAQEQPRAFLGVRSRCGAFIHPQLVIQGPGVLTTQLSFPSQASSLVTGTACGHHGARGQCSCSSRTLPLPWLKAAARRLSWVWLG